MADNDFRVKRGIVVGTDAFISNSITSVNTISFNTTQEFNPGIGSLAWDNAQGSISLGLSNTVDLQLGLKNLFYVKNQTGSTIFSNTVVMANGTVGNSGTILISPAIGNGNFPARYIMGVTAESIDNGEDGYVLSFGKLREINTSMFSEGDILYLDPANPGKMTNTEPVAPSVKAAVAIVVTKHPTAGEIFVRPTFSDKLLDIQDVYISNNISNGQSIAWVSANSRFENMTISAEQSNVYNTYTTLSANDYNTLLAAYSNDYATLLSAQSNDGATLLTARSNDWSTLLTAQANDFNSFTTLTANIYNTLLSAQSNDGATLLTARANDFNTFTTLSANDFNSFTTLNSRINTVQGNLSSSSSNTAIYLDNTLVSNSALIFQSSNGLSISGNTTSKVITFSIGMSNVTSQEFTANGAANAFTLAKSVANSHMILVSYNGILQKPTTYVIAGTTLTLSNTLPIESGSDIEVRFFDFFDLPGATSGGGGGASFQGSVSGYTSGGQSPASNVVDKFPFSADGNATDVGDLTVARFEIAGQSSTTSGYTSGGNLGPAFSNIIDKFPFAANANATDVGDLTESRGGVAGQSSSTSGYRSGGSYPRVNTIDKFSFAADGNATDVGDLTRIARNVTGQSSTTHGYTSGGYNHSVSPATFSNIIDKFPFAASGNASDVGDLTQTRSAASGQSSTASGYTSGGFTFTPGGYSYVNTIDKFPFASNGNASDVGDLVTGGRGYVAGQSSTASGYTSGGIGAGNNIIDKFPFSTNANSTDVGDLSVARRDSAGQQV